MSAKKEKSLLIFQGFVHYKESGEVDVRGLFSQRCFEHWLQSRANVPKNPPEAFRKALTSHCSGVDGRRPFEPKVEEALLLELRKKQVWECFKHTDSKVGQRGLQVKGYWEKQRGEVDCDDVKPSKRRRVGGRTVKRKRIQRVKQEALLPTKQQDNRNILASASELLLPLEAYATAFTPQVYRVIDPFEELLLDLQ